MTNKQILKKAIEKAYKNGWGKGVDDRKLDWTISHDVRFMSYQYWYSIIFSHDFAKAFWGEDWGTHPKGSPFRVKPWMFHLQKLVLEPEPLRYLEKFL